MINIHIVMAITTSSARVAYLAISREAADDWILRNGTPTEAYYVDEIFLSTYLAMPALI